MLFLYIAEKLHMTIILYGVSLYYDMVVFHLMLMVPPSVVSGLNAEGCLNHWQLFGFVIVVI